MLEQGALVAPLPVGSGYEDGFPRKGIESRIVHTGRQAARGRDEILDLLGTKIQLRGELRQLHRLPETGPRV